MTATPVLQVRDAHVRHRIPGKRPLTKDTVYALTGADLTVEAGETVGIVGESGCGKSTLAQVIVGLRRPDDGSVVFRGRDLWAMKPAERRNQFGREVGMIFQDASTALNRRLTVRAILRDPLDIQGVGTARERQARVKELLDLVGLPGSAADALPSQLSGGQRQRVAIGRALALEPSLLVADEPTSALDVSVRAQILNLLLRLKKDLNLSLVFISHDIQTVRRMSDRIVTMYLGRIVETAPRRVIPTLVRHPYTAALLSATPSILHPVEPIGLTGPVPSSVNPPSGCPFHPRCWRAQPDCAATMPAVETVDAAHIFRCLHPVAGDEQPPPPPESLPDNPAVTVNS
ncbi:oligopeptide/dipeptide ABC transporter ATP-binding protein [Micropruina sonneratiae]|uniref:oligopeptide/dipeptide ABC transporter ATP-binding protein n=1 Tax=Micropruina sonneratiae TaxID=2986940 RepID=UPI002227128A|nr:ABC transporter ATP-binding protein [Micropruina sp. KQZ13P-5]MCW3156965.1 ABC transporter ATP-binding protein [Micropruina sp. KQZ13P-5]